MPTYEYECKSCNQTFEKFQKMSDKPLKQCYKCDGELRRLIGSGAGIIFKGSGFYITDYKNKSEDQSHKQSNKTDNKNPETKEYQKVS